VNLKDHTNLSN
jgi:hypothetical protein